MRYLSLLLIVVVSIFILYGCGESEPQTIVERTQYKFDEDEDFSAGKICVDSNMGGAPFIIRDRDRIYEITDNTYVCHVLEPGGYEVEFLSVREAGKVPPKAENLELKAALRIDVTGIYILKEPEG